MNYVRARTSRARSPKFLTAGVHGLLKGPGSSRVFEALSCYLSLILKHSYTKWDTKQSRSNWGGGGLPAAPPLDPPLN